MEHDLDKISIHTLRVEGDSCAKTGHMSVWISIHTLRVEGDFQILKQKFSQRNISIHTLRVEGDLSCVWTCVTMLPISIHTLRVEGDVCKLHGRALQDVDFNPHPPRGG